jgi:glycosyltransferase involved in cell wall biosynthesis
MTPKHKILLICPSFVPPMIGGHKVWTHNLIENSGLHIDVLTGKIKKGFSEISGDKINMIRKDFIFGTSEEIVDPRNIDLIKSYYFIMQWLLKISLTHKYQVVIVHGFVILNPLIILLCKCLRIKVICMGNAEEYTLALYGKGLKPFIQKLFLKLHKYSDAYIVVCHFAKRILNKQGLDNKKIFVIPSSVNNSKIAKTIIKKERGNRILSVGRLVERKGFHKLIDAANHLRKQIPDIFIDIVGDGPYKEEILKQIEILKMKDHVILHSNLSDDALSNLYQESNLFVLAHMMLENGDTEGCPTVFSEASGSGLPVIGGTGAGADTVIVEGETGYIVDVKSTEELRDKVKKVLLDRNLAFQLGQNGIKKIKSEHTPEVTGKQFRSLIDTVLLS